MPEDYALMLEEMKRMMANASGTNLAGQPQPGSYGSYTPDFSYGSYNIPATDPTYSSGYEYARTIAGGMPFEDVVAPGMSFSPDQPMGYTQADLRRKEIYGDFDGVMPAAPTQGTPLEASYETMPDAPVGTPAPERYVPGQTPFPGIPNFLKDLDFSFLENLDLSNLPRPENIQDIKGVENIRPSLFDVDVQEILKDVDTLKNIDTKKFEDIDFSNIDIPSVVPTMPTAPVIQQPITPVVQERTIPVIPEVPVMPRVPVQAPMNFTGLPQMPSMPIEPMVQPITAPVMPTKVLPQPIFANAPKPQPLPMPQVPVMPEPIVPAPRPAPVPQAPIQVPSLPSLPMNFTGLPQIPVMPEPIAPLPVIPQIPVMPQITYTPPVPSFVQPRIEDIVSPIRAGSLRNFQQPGLFSLV